jgi:hypothetical protein
MQLPGTQRQVAYHDVQLPSHHVTDKVPLDVEKRQAMDDITHARDVCMNLDSRWGKHETNPMLSGLEVPGELLTRK